MTEPTESASPATKTAPLAIWSLVLGILGIIPFGLLGAVPAVICGHIARPKIKGSGGTIVGQGRATAGLVLGYIGIVLHLLILPAMLLPAIAEARNRARRVKCLSNLSQIGKGCYMYSTEHEESFPPDLKTMAEQTGYYPELFVCPTTGKTPGEFSSLDEWSDYILVPNRSMGDSPNAVLAFSRPDCYPDKGGNVLTVDGAVYWHDIAEYDELTTEFR